MKDNEFLTTEELNVLWENSQSHPKLEFYSKYFHIPKYRLYKWFRKLFGNDNNAYVIQKECNNHRNEIVISTGDYSLIRLLGWTNQHEDDYYYIAIMGNAEIHLLTCVGGFIPLKGKISNYDYYSIDKSFNMNFKSAEIGIKWCEENNVIIK